MCSHLASGDTNHIIKPYQYAHHKFSATETAILYILNDLLVAVDN